MSIIEFLSLKSATVFEPFCSSRDVDCVHNALLWAFVSVPTDSAPSTQSPKRGGDYCDMASSQSMLSEGEKRKRVGFDWWMVWK